MQWVQVVQLLGRRGGWRSNCGAAWRLAAALAAAVDGTRGSQQLLPVLRQQAGRNLRADVGLCLLG